MAVSTVCAVLTRLGLNRLWRLEPLEPPNRYCRRHPGELIHIDIKKLGRFRRPGHRVRGRGPGRDSPGAGWEAVPRLRRRRQPRRLRRNPARRDARSTVGFFERAVAWFAARGVTVRQVHDRQRCRAYRSDVCTVVVLDSIRIEHLRTRPYRPRTNGKAERFIQDHAPRMGLRRRLRRPQRTDARALPALARATTTTNDPTAPSATRPRRRLTTEQRPLGTTASGTHRRQAP